MITRQHSALYMLALATKERDYVETLHNELPFVLLPDAIRAYIGPRQAGHFEQTPDGNDCSWMVYPSEETLMLLTKENASEKISHYVAEGYPKCVIGEKTNVDLFDRKNWMHKHYHALRIHMLQDYILDDILRKMIIDPTRRFKDEFVARHNNSLKLNGSELRAQIAEFENLGFIKLVGAVYERTGVLLDADWFDENVYKALLMAYPKDLAENTYRFIKFSDELDERIKAHNFEISDEEKAKLTMVDNLEDVLDALYSDAYLYTFSEI